MTYFKKSMGISHINQDWQITWEEGDNTIWMRDLYWWERIILWKWPDKSIKS